MGLWDSVKKQFIEVIDWTESGDDVLAWRFPVSDNEIKNGAQLTVRETQLALFVDQGHTADKFGPGLHKLSTDNMPVLTKLKSWPTGFTSPFKSEVYFYSLRQRLGQRWGTPQPITVRDAEFGSVQLRMFGIFSYHVQDAVTFFRQVSGTRDAYTTDDLAAQLVPQISGSAAGVFAKSGVPFLDMAANQLALGAALKEALQEPFGKLGLVLDSFVVESVSLPDPLQKALNDRQSMGILGNMQGFAQYQAAKSIPDAAKNTGGLAGTGASLAVGAAMGQAMAGAFGGAPSAAAPAHAPPAAPQTGCVSCGKPLDADSTFCRHCGKPQKVTCPKCSAVFPGDTGFCSKCGTKIA